MDEVREWQLEKYSRITYKGAVEGKNWETLESSHANQLKLSITQNGIMTVKVDGRLLEYCNLVQRKDVKPVKHLDCLLFLCNTKDGGRKWRVKFFGESSSEAEERCHLCHRTINTFLLPSSLILPSSTASLYQQCPSSSTQNYDSHCYENSFTSMINSEPSIPELHVSYPSSINLNASSILPQPSEFSVYPLPKSLPNASRMVAETLSMISNSLSVPPSLPNNPSISSRPHPVLSMSLEQNSPQLTSMCEPIPTFPAANIPASLPSVSPFGTSGSPLTSISALENIPAQPTSLSVTPLLSTSLSTCIPSVLPLTASRSTSGLMSTPLAPPSASLTVPVEQQSISTQTVLFPACIPIPSPPETNHPKPIPPSISHSKLRSPSPEIIPIVVSLSNSSYESAPPMALDLASGNPIKPANITSVTSTTGKKAPRKRKTKKADTTGRPSLWLQRENLVMLGQCPTLEELVQAVLQDPQLPEIVDAVHKVISKM